LKCIVASLGNNFSYPFGTRLDNIIDWSKFNLLIQDMMAFVLMVTLMALDNDDFNGG
jgi:hypothetical protein